MSDAERNWKWWAGQTDEFYTVGPCESKDEAINEAISDGIGEWLDVSQTPHVWMQSFSVIEATHDPLRLADWIYADTMLERADDALADSDRVSCEHDGNGPWFKATPEQEADLIQRVKAACDEWQAAHGLVFKSTTFSHQRNEFGVTRAIAGGKP